MKFNREHLEELTLQKIKEVNDEAGYRSYLEVPEMVNIIASISSFGIATVSVREIAIANADENPNKISEMISLLQKMALCIGLFGAIITLIFSKLLSQLTFGNTNYSYWFVILSINFIITSYATIQASILQGKNKLKAIAISNVVSGMLEATIDGLADVPK